MSRFRYFAVLDSGQRVGGTVRSHDRQEALRQLLSRGYHPLALEPAEGGGLGTWRISRDSFRRVSVADLAVFTRQLASLLRAGLPMVQALGMLRRQIANRRLAGVIQEIEETLSREGGTLADCFEEHTRVFNAVYRGLVRAGEEGGNLVDVLEALADHLARSARMRGQVLGAFVYPIFLVLVGMAAIFVLMSFVIPRFQEMFEGLGQALPLPTRILITVSAFLARWWWAVLVAVATAGVFIWAALRRPVVREKVDVQLLRVPVLGSMWLKLELARICRTLSALLSSGVKILDALRIAGDTAGNLAVRKTFPDMIQGILAGESLAMVAERAGIYPPIMLNLIRTGEETGELPEMLDQLSAIYEDEADRSVTGAVRLVEPTLIIVMGGIICAIVAAVMLPILQTTAAIR